MIKVKTNVETEELYALIGRLYVLLEKNGQLLTAQDQQNARAQAQLKQLLAENTVLKKTLGQMNGQPDPEPEPDLIDLPKDGGTKWDS